VCQEARVCQEDSMVVAPSDAAGVAEGPLEGLRVLDLTRFVAGPFATQMLGDFGADVAKVEPPAGGDGMRHVDRMLGEPDSLFSMQLNRSKRSIALDLYRDEGRQVLDDMILAADVLIENFRAGTLERMGLDWPRLHALNPRLIVVRISGFGQDGPWAGRGSYDPVIQALSGLMALTGQPDGPPTVCGTVITDYLTGLYATIGTLTALQARERTGEGQWVDVSMLDATTSLLMTAISQYKLFGRKATRRGNKNPISVPSHVFVCNDGGHVHITAWSDPEFAKLCKVMGRPELPRDPRFGDVESRTRNDRAIEQIIADWAATMDSHEMERRLLVERLPAARVADIADVADNPQLRHRGHIVEVEHPVQGRVPTTGPAVRFSDTPVRDRFRMPALGENSADILSDWLGYDPDRIAALVEQGVVGTR